VHGIAVAENIFQRSRGFVSRRKDFREIRSNAQGKTFAHINVCWYVYCQDEFEKVKIEK
jgi:hypothetical protein